MKKQFAVIGDPIEHSKSPVMHNAAFRHLNIDAEYLKIHVKIEDLKEFIEDARKDLDGFNVTVPHKYEIIPYLDEISELARISESVNTVTVKNGKLYGDTTDGYGLEMGIKESFGLNIKNETVTFLGCGGAVKAVATHFASHGIKKMYFVNRTISRAEQLIENIKKYFPVELACCVPTDEAQIKQFLEDSGVLVQGTSLGLKEDDPAPINLDLIPEHICIYDTIYKKTKLLKYAEENGNKYADGRSMLLHQGAKSFSIWTGADAPVKIMKEALFSSFAE